MLFNRQKKIVVVVVVVVVSLTATGRDCGACHSRWHTVGAWHSVRPLYMFILVIAGFINENENLMLI